MTLPVRATWQVLVIPPHSMQCLCHTGELKAIDCLMVDGSLSPFPVLQCRNVYVLPGVPHLLRKKWAVGASLRPLLLALPLIALCKAVSCLLHVKLVLLSYVLDGEGS